MDRGKIIKDIIGKASKNGNDFYSFDSSNDVNEWIESKVVVLDDEKALNKLSDEELNEVFDAMTKIQTRKPSKKPSKAYDYKVENKILLKEIEGLEKESEALQNNITDLCKQYNKLNTERRDKEAVIKMIIESGHDDEMKLRLIKNLL